MKAYENIVTHSSGAFPSTLAINASGAGALDGTEYLAGLLNEQWGFVQGLLTQANLTPSGTTDTYSASQQLQAMQMLFGAPGDLYLSLVQNPATLGVRALILTGQVILISSYPDLVANTYIGDTNNANTAYQYFYKCSDSGGVTRSTSGTYFKLPDFRGVFLRGLDTGATRNPNGASDFLGNYRADAFQGHYHSNTRGATSSNFTTSGTSAGAGTLNSTDYPIVGAPITDGTHGTPRTDSETRPMQGIIQIGIRY